MSEEEIKIGELIQGQGVGVVDFFADEKSVKKIKSGKQKKSVKKVKTKKDKPKNTSYKSDNEELDIRKIRQNLNMTREEFAKTFSFTVRSIQNWERGFRKPNPHTLAYLKLITQNPLKIKEMLDG